MKRILLTIICLLFCFMVKAQSQYTCRYWYDQNFAQAVTTTFSDNTWQAELDVSALGTGVHFLHIHVADTSMSWGPSQSFLFIKTDPTEQGLSGLTYHCWFDEDFEHQQVNSVGEGSFLLDVSGLSDGIHFVHIMLKGGDYSSTRSYMFMKMPVSPMEEWQFRCWFDWDYTTLQTGVVGGSFFLVDVSWLPIGQHTMTMQLNNGSLTPARTYEFYRMPIITVAANPTEGGTPICQVDDTICTLTAIPGIGYHFLNWTKDGEEVTTDVTYSFTMTEDETYVANFEINSYEITVDATPSVGGSAAGAGIYNHFASCTLTATPNIGYHFVNWTKDSLEVSTDAEYTFEVDGPGDYVAHFILNSYDITATADPAGAGTISGAGTYNHFSNCTLTATAATGYTFQNWTLDSVVVSTETEYSFEVSGAAAYVAHFILNSYDITATTDPAGAGTISGAGTYNHFSTCTLTATAATGYTFQNWTLDGEVVSTETEYSFEVSGAAAYVAHFTLNSYDITATVDPAEAGTVSGTGTYNHFSTCTLTATAATGYTFQNWTLDGEVVSTETEYSFEVSGAAAYVAHFTLNSYDITATVDPAEAGTVSGTGTYNHFSTCTLTATASTGYTFQNWTLDGEVVSTETEYSFEVSGAVAYVAHFTLNSYDITATVDPAEAGTVSGAGTYNHFSTCTLTATPNEDYAFVNWTKDGEEVSTEASYSFTVTEEATYVANFAIIAYHFTTTGNWSSVSNWRCGALPGTNDEVFIDAPCQLNQDATVAALTVSNGQSLTLQSGKILTVTGNLINTVAAGLVIEDGAQLIHNVANVQATVKKLISPFNGTNDSWHLIALPITGNSNVASVSNLLEGEYDLYGYDESTTYWKNRKTTGSGFTVLETTKGYLYANGEEVILGFSGTLENGSATITVPLSFTDGAHLSGFNLVGNPFPCNAYLNREYFVLTSDGTDINPEPIPATTPIPPCTAVFVKAVAEGETVVFTRVAP